MTAVKRKLDDIVSAGSVVLSSNNNANKKARMNEQLIKNNEGALISRAPDRTSSLSSPIMLLSGHQKAVNGCKFSPKDGTTIASCSSDRQIFLWNTYGVCENKGVLKGDHSGAVLDVHWMNGDENIVSCSTDKTIVVWDVEYGDRVKKLRGHNGIVNSCCPSRSGNLIVGGSDDKTARIWDMRRGKKATHTFENEFQITSVCFGKDDYSFFSAGIDSRIKAWDLRMNKVTYMLEGHTDMVTGIALSPDGDYLLSTAADNTVKNWDVRAFNKGGRLRKQFIGAKHNFEKNLLKCSWSHDGKYVSAGSSDRMVYVWEEATCRPLYRLPGHSGSVNCVDFHPSEDIIVSASSDKRLYLGEVQLN